MKKRTVKLIAGSLCFILFWASVIVIIQKLLVPKYQTGVVEGSMVEEYYENPFGHDVIMVGDCEVYESVSTVELYRKYGISSYLRGSAQQLIWQSYYLLEDALRYETPKVAVFNVYSLIYNEPKNEAYNRMSIDGMTWSMTKVDDIRASMLEDEHFEDYVFPLFRYHARWSSLTDDDFTHIFCKDEVTFNGYYMRIDSMPAVEDGFTPVRLTDYTLGSNAMSYLDKMARLCKENGVELVLIKAPIQHFNEYWWDEWDAQVVKYAEEKGLTYINFIPLSDEIGLDIYDSDKDGFADTYDGGLHLNLSGAEKFSDYFGAWLKENYDLPDRREDEKVDAVWQKVTENYNNEIIKQQNELAEYGKIVSRAPVTEEETGLMKNFIILAVLAILCLALVACGNGNQTVSETSGEANSAAAESGSGQTVNELKGFYFAVGDTKIYINADMAPIREALGEPAAYQESESCAFQGLDKVFSYGSYWIRTYPKDGVDYVLSVELKDDTVSTAEKLYIGDSVDKVKEIYGEPTVTNENSLVYVKDGICLNIFLNENNQVKEINYIEETK
ncbi:MAG: hypothetical protein J5793_02790 [Clostridia bacterium]|nr:hypothetical protein [Clostridia bacterium]